MYWKSSKYYKGKQVQNQANFKNRSSALFAKSLYEFDVFEKAVEKLINFQSDLRLNKFVSFITFMYWKCETFEAYYTEKKRKDSIRNPIFQMQKYLNE